MKLFKRNTVCAVLGFQKVIKAVSTFFYGVFVVKQIEVFTVR